MVNGEAPNSAHFACISEEATATDEIFTQMLPILLKPLPQSESKQYKQNIS